MFFRSNQNHSGILWQMISENCNCYVTKLKIGFLWEIYTSFDDVPLLKGWKASFSSAVLKCHKEKEKLPAQINSWEVVE